MSLLFNLSIRNFIKQKRRNLFLGIGIAFGMMILVIANSFSQGMMDVLINDIVTYTAGHLEIRGMTDYNPQPMISDKYRVEKIIRETIKPEDIVQLEEALGVYVRAVGNGEADNVTLVGASVNTEEEKKEFFQDYFTLLAGNFDDYFSKKIQYPVIISKAEAESLNVKVNDFIRVRVPMVTGQIQTAKLTVIAIVKSNSSFTDSVLFMEDERVKKILGYQSWEAPNFQIILKDPEKNARKYADLLHQKLKPDILSIMGRVNDQPGQVLAFKNNDQVKNKLKNKIKIISGNSKEAFSKDGVMLSRKMAEKAGLKAGDDFKLEYETKYRGSHQESFKVDAIYDSVGRLGSNIILMNEEVIQKIYNRYLPEDHGWGIIHEGDDLSDILATEWKLLERSQDSKALEKKYRKEREIKTDQAKIDVVTMYESAADVLKLEGVLNLITIAAVVILFFIILIGVINTLRMTIKERTREIGTVRAVGMQKKDVRNLFIMETVLLTVISCIIGILLGIIAMMILGSIQLDINNALSMILKDKHLNFKLNYLSIIFNFILIVIISAVTAYFPASRAAKLPVIEALGKYE